VKVVVVGAGVVGLTTAVALRSVGVEADVVAREPPERTTSAVAAALWFPYRALPVDRVTAWSAASYAELARLADVPGSGVRMLSGTEMLDRDAPDPWWRDAVPDLRRTDDGVSFTAPVADMSVHLPWLVDRLQALGAFSSSAT
jgi:D-amino-acid oxidase